MIASVGNSLSDIISLNNVRAKNRHGFIAEPLIGDSETNPHLSMTLESVNEVKSDDDSLSATAYIFATLEKMRCAVIEYPNGKTLFVGENEFSEREIDQFIKE
jgi:hypothetical protein